VASQTANVNTKNKESLLVNPALLRAIAEIIIRVRNSNNNRILITCFTHTIIMKIVRRLMRRKPSSTLCENAEVRITPSPVTAKILIQLGYL